MLCITEKVLFNLQGLVRPDWLANGFVREGKQTKHAEFNYLVTKFISSDTRGSCGGSHNPFVEHINPTMAIHQTGISVCFVQWNFFEPAQNFPMDETDIAGKEAGSLYKKQT